VTEHERPDEERSERDSREEEEDTGGSDDGDGEEDGVSGFYDSERSDRPE